MVIIHEIETHAFDINNILTITNCIDVSKPFLQDYKPMDSTTIMDPDSDYDEDIEEIGNPEERDYFRTYNTEEKKTERILKYALKWNDEDAIGFEYRPLPWDTKGLIGRRIKIVGPVQVVHRIGLLTRENCELLSLLPLEKGNIGQGGMVTGSIGNDNNHNYNHSSHSHSHSHNNGNNNQNFKKEEYDLIDDDLFLNEASRYDLINDDDLLFDI